MKKLSLWMGLFLLSVSVHADIYKWTDSSGNTHFSDKRQPGATAIDLPPVQSYSSPSDAKTTDKPNGAQSDIKEDSVALDDTAPYSSVAITQPEPEATIRNNQGDVSVMAIIEPALRPGNTVQLLYDGAELGEPQA